MPARPQPDHVFRALADPTRRAILARLRVGEVAAGDIAAGFRISRPAISRHIRVLRRARLVTEHRDGRNRFYALNPDPLRSLDDWLDDYRQFWKGRLLALKRHVEFGGGR
jgi:DNA-binding transcriptional ArsR family regulator